MPTTRSATRSAATPKEDVFQLPPQVKPKNGVTKRKAAGNTIATATKKARTGTTTIKETIPKAPTKPVQPIAATAQDGATQAFVPAVLTFSFEDAKEHLIGVDPRFESIFDKLKCKPFEHLERVDPFRTLTTSILGQQISWLAARSITWRFIRLFDPSMPEKTTDYSSMTARDSFFPSAAQVAQADVATLRTAGLSQRKAEYVQDLASRFADGRLSTQKLLEADDEELYELLTAVRGIGRWTVDMFAIFSLRRPDILPVGDLGVQRGVARWFLSLHSPSHKIDISPQKLPKAPNEDDEEGLSGALAPTKPPFDASSLPPAPALPETPKKSKQTKKVDNEEDDEDLGPLPPPFTPSINRTLNAPVSDDVRELEPFPESLSVAILKSRLDGKKKIKGALLTPQEMEELTNSWRPYRSLGVYYMWSLASV
ncbi:DNA glycosylase [Neolentinus lepideus HHB14362 ss-1]|uniref:DNA glycosylase n=1 Tax=Neolentinus lepideus HHB14362 ss-1 TaxID=1314782 RepID=A0A165TLD5_9AGAM|nr:DNA glycosylase [Neolentinus lepideus HHB14362 ss-1]